MGAARLRQETPKAPEISACSSENPENSANIVDYRVCQCRSDQIDLLELGLIKERKQLFWAPALMLKLFL
ncbi:hypothetical protein KI387_015066, partial [Taxus chinensis]